MFTMQSFFSWLRQAPRSRVAYHRCLRRLTRSSRAELAALRLGWEQW